MRNLRNLVAGLAVVLGAGFAQASGPNHAAALVEGWYQQYLHRCAEPAGLISWTTNLANGMSPTCVQAAILGSDEYYVNHGACPSGFVNGLYNDVLGRPAAPEEVHNWASQLGHCGNRTQVAEMFLASAQNELSGPRCPPPAALPAAPAPAYFAPAVVAPRPVFVAPPQRAIVTVARPRVVPAPPVYRNDFGRFAPPHHSVARRYAR